MVVERRTLFVYFALLALAGQLYSAPITIQAVAASGVAHAGTASEAVILIRLSNPDGTPWVFLTKTAKGQFWG